jgi:membrane-associated phospholipid phosphatase
LSTDPDSPIVRFEPLRPASRRRMVLAIVIGPLLWIVAFVTVGLVLHFSSAIELGLLIVLLSAVLSLILLAALRLDRVRQEKRYAARG